MPNRKPLDVAQEYLDRGWSVLPVGQDKRPLGGKWGDFQKRRATDKELQQWREEFPDAGVGIIAGEISGLLIVDIDATSPNEFAAAQSKIDECLGDSFLCPIARSQRGGHHLYFKRPECGMGNRTRIGGLPIDVRCDGGYVVAPPSPGYTWVVSPSECEIPELPAALLVFLSKPRPPVVQAPATEHTSNPDFLVERARRYVEKVHSAISGSRGHDSTYDVACRLVWGFCLDDYDTLSILHEYNSRCQPPWSEKELLHKIESAHKETKHRHPEGYLRDSRRDRPDEADRDNEENGPSKEQRGIPLRAIETTRIDFTTPIPPPSSTGIPGADEAGVLFRAASAIILVAETGSGKTGLAIQAALTVAKTRPVVYVTTELPRRQIEARAVAQMWGDPWVLVYDRGPESADIIADTLKDLSLYIVEYNSGCVTDSLNVIADTEGQHPILILDYLQHAARRRSDVDPRVAVAKTSDEVGDWLRRTGSSALLISSTARHNYGSQFAGQRRTARDFVGAAKESGDLEYDAANVLAMEVDFESKADSLACKLHVAKARFGPTGATIGLRFYPRIGRFEHDPTAAVDEEDREIISAVANGADSSNLVFKAVGGTRGDVQKRIRALVKQGILNGPTLTLSDSQRDYNV